MVNESSNNKSDNDLENLVRFDNQCSTTNGSEYFANSSCLDKNEFLMFPKATRHFWATFFLFGISNTYSS